MHFDLYWFSYINNLAGHSTALDKLGVFFASYSEYVWALVLLLALFWPKEARLRNRVVVVMSVVAALVARLVVKGLIVLVYPRPRPFVVLTNAHQLISSPVAENYQSFPSGHAIFFFALAAVIFCFNKKWGAFALLAAALMGIARVYVGVHWPSDIIGGAILGSLTGWCVYWYYSHHKIHTYHIVAKGFRTLGL